MKLVDFGLMALLWSYGMIYVRLLTLMSVFHCPEFVEEQPAYNGLLFNLVVPSVPRGRQWAKLNRDIQDVEVTRASLSSQRDLVLGTCPDGRLGPVPHSSNWRLDSSPRASCTTKSSVCPPKFLLLWFEQTNQQSKLTCSCWMHMLYKFISATVLTPWHQHFGAFVIG